MLIEILDFLKKGETYSLQELANILNTDIEAIKTQMEYLEKYSYIKKVVLQTDCGNKCGGCTGCSYGMSNFTMWEVDTRSI